MGTDFNNRAAMNWGPIQTPNQQAAQQNAVNSVDSKQKPLVRAIASLIQAASADLYASNEDRKYRYIVDLILDRIRAALNTQLSDLSDTQLQAVSKQNEALLKSISTSTSGIVEGAFSKLGVTLDKKQADDILDQFNDKLDAAVAALADQIKQGQFSTSKKSSTSEDAATKTDQLETIKSIDALKKQLAKQFSADKSSNNAPTTSSGKKAFKAASALVISKQLIALAKNQKVINQSMTKRFEKTTKTISGGVERLHDTTSTNFYNLNDKLEDSMAKLGRQTKRISASIVAGVVGAISLITVGIKKTFGALFSGLKAISSGLFKLFKKPAGVIGDLLKNLIATPGGMFAIGWIAGYVWKKWLKPLWDWAKPIRDAIGEWFGGKISFKDMIEKVWSHLKGGILQMIDGIKNWFTENWGTIKSIGKTVWEWIKTNATAAWEFMQPHLQTFWNKILEPALSKAWEWTKDKVGKFWDWLLDQEVGGFKVRTWMIGIGAVIGAYAVYKVFKIIRGIYRFGKAIFTVIKWIKAGFGKLLRFFKVKIPKGPKLGKGGRGRGHTSSKGKGKGKGKSRGKNKTPKKKTTRSQRAKAQPRDAKGRFIKKQPPTGKKPPSPLKKAPTPKKLPTPKPTPKPAGNAAKVGQMAGKGLKVAAKAAGAALVIADAAGNTVEAYDAFKNGEIAEGLSQTGFATAKAATLAAGPLAPVAYGAIMATEAINDSIKASTAEIDAAVDDMNQRTEEVFKTKVLGAIKEQGKKLPFDRLLDKYKNFDKTKAEVDPLTEKMQKLQAKLDKMNDSTWDKLFNGDKIRKLYNEIDELNMQRQEILGKAGLNLNEISKSKDRLLDSRSSKAILEQMTPEMQARFKQIMAEQTKIGPDNLKILPDMQKVLEQLKQEYEGGGPVTEKVDQVGDGVEKLQEQQLQNNQKLSIIVDWINSNPTTGQPLTIINAPQVQAQERSLLTTMDK